MGGSQLVSSKKRKEKKKMVNLTDYINWSLSTGAFSAELETWSSYTNQPGTKKSRKMLQEYKKMDALTWINGLNLWYPTDELEIQAGTGSRQSRKREEKQRSEAQSRLSISILWAKILFAMRWICGQFGRRVEGSERTSRTLQREWLFRQRSGGGKKAWCRAQSRNSPSSSGWAVKFCPTTPPHPKQTKWLLQRLYFPAYPGCCDRWVVHSCCCGACEEQPEPPIPLPFWLVFLRGDRRVMRLMVC